MQDKTAQAVAILQGAKQEGMSYYDATQKLASQGFDQETIEDASDRFDYQKGVMRSTDPESHKPTFEQKAAEKEELDDQLRQADNELEIDRIDDSMDGFRFK